MSVLRAGNEFVILFFRDDIYFCTVVNFAVNGHSIRFRRIHCDLDLGHDFGAGFFFFYVQYRRLLEYWV